MKTIKKGAPPAESRALEERPDGLEERPARGLRQKPSSEAVLK